MIVLRTQLPASPQTFGRAASTSDCSAGRSALVQRGQLGSSAACCAACSLLFLPFIFSWNFASRDSSQRRWLRFQAAARLAAEPPHSAWHTSQRSWSCSEPTPQLAVPRVVRCYAQLTRRIFKQFNIFFFHCYLFFPRLAHRFLLVLDRDIV